MVTIVAALQHRAAGLAARPARAFGGRLVRGTSSGATRPSRVARTAKKRGGSEEAGAESIYSGTVSLPKTSFDQRANAVVREPELQAFWKDARVYERLRDTNPGEPFTLHDGPPYANGDLHCGHALNKVLKDFINRFQMMQGRRVRFVPGWDCHGLPIELKVLQGIKSTTERRALTPLALRERAGAFALEAVDRQRAQFQRFGVWADWEAPYLTLDPAYEAAQLGVFGAMALNGHIYRGKKPVHWSPSTRTALAEAELEYPEGHTSRSIYVAMDVVVPSATLASLLAGAPASLAIWTTTPWTIPANLAIAINEKIEYALVRTPDGRALVVAKELVGALGATLGRAAAAGAASAPPVPLEHLGSLSGAELAGSRYRHPLVERDSPVVAGGEYITTESGTGLVHTAPGHGRDDYLTGMKYGLPLLSPVDDGGLFTAEAGPRLEGKSVLSDGNAEVIAMLAEAGALLAEESYAHKYPYDWRSKKPTIFRATEQWFASVDGFRDGALAAIGDVQWLPPSGKNRITAMTEGRSDWCISRQRAWGVPIPVFYKKGTGEALLTPETVEHVRALVAARGSNVWWEASVAELLPEGLRGLADEYEIGTDTMDVWFDSGSSWSAVADARQGLRYPADLYLEGSDQHRGWFQSSLLTSVAARGGAPYKTVLTHGFVLDEKGLKMSKSLGNVVDPMLVIGGGKDLKKEPPYGADVLRLWVSTVDYSSDVSIGPNILKQVFESYRKLRNTLRYLVGNLHDYSPQAHAVLLDELPQIDRWMLAQLDGVKAEVHDAYSTYQFYRAAQALMRFAVSDLSNFYLDIAKDRLYISAPNDPRRRACQTVLSALSEEMARAVAPLLPHLAEDVWQNLPYKSELSAESVFLSGWSAGAVDAAAAALAAERYSGWAAVREVRDDVNKALELARTQKLIGASLDAAVFIHAPNATLAQILGALPTDGVNDLRYVMLASTVELCAGADDVVAKSACVVTQRESATGCTVGVAPAGGTKCERCWNYCDSVGKDAAHPAICHRCVAAVNELGMKAPVAAGTPGAV